MNENQIIQNNVEFQFESGIMKRFLLNIKEFQFSVSSETHGKVIINLLSNHSKDLNNLKQNLDSLKELKLSNEESIVSLLEFFHSIKNKINFLLEIRFAQSSSFEYIILKPILENERPLTLKLKKRIRF